MAVPGWTLDSQLIRRAAWIALATAAPVLLAAAPSASALAIPEARQHERGRYALANGCYALKAGDRFVVKTDDGGYRAMATPVQNAERFRMQASDLGRYLLYGKDRDFLALGTKPVAERCSDVLGDRDERKPSTGEGKPSDHAPVVVDLS